MRSIIVHGHFYQPPRENPWTGAVDHEDSARPYHDWNERVHAECYRPNAFARIVDSRGRPVQIVNNYANISFNFGPTLLSWLEERHPETYARILEADRTSVRRRGGHGNAIAQVYSHPILPLLGGRDRLTQIHWGIADFRHRFGRAPEALWLPETACNDATLSDLIGAGLRFVILSPYQAERVRPLADGEWVSVADGSIDPREPYRYYHRDGSGRSIAIFFYDANAARAVAFEGALGSSQTLIDRLELGLGEGGTLVNAATDGESYGHHYRFGDRALAYALEVLARERALRPTNYGEFLAGNPPRREVEIKAGPNGEGTAWSCAHGVGRWYRDCGCQTGGEEGWNQAWRGPLRAAFDLLRDAAAAHFEAGGGELFRDLWAARDAYIGVILAPSRRESFLRRHCGRHLGDDEQVRALKLLEMQRNAMLMYTSCGWFFADISGLESVQVMKYAGRVLDLMDELDLAAPLEKFLERLGEAKSNIAAMGNGADVYRRLVGPCRVAPARLAAHLAICGLGREGEEEGTVGDNRFRQELCRKQQNGRLTMATSRLKLTLGATGERRDYAAAALHLGGLDFYAALRPFAGVNRFKGAADRLSQSFRTASLPALLRLVQGEFGPDEYGFNDMLSDGRRSVSEMVFGRLLEGFAAQFMRLYEDNRRLVEMLHEAGFELPAELRQVTEFALGRRFEEEVSRQKRSHDPAAYVGALEIAQEVAHYGYRIDRSRAERSFEEMIREAARRALDESSAENLSAVIGLIELAGKLGVEPSLEEAQEMLFDRVSAGGAALSEKLVELAAALKFAPDFLRRLEPAAKEGGAGSSDASAPKAAPGVSAGQAH